MVPLNLNIFMSVWILDLKSAEGLYLHEDRPGDVTVYELHSWCVVYLVSRAGRLFWEGADQPGPSPPGYDRQGRRGSPDHLRENSLKGYAHEHTQQIFAL
jgi:hypothetical protein